MATQGKRRALGQHFLRDQTIASSIAEKAIELKDEWKCNSILEIGPGKGAITLPLFQELERKNDPDQKFLLVEKDYQFAENWKAHSSEVSFHVKVGDFLDLPTEAWLFAPQFVVVSNLPYSAGTAILDRLARQQEHIPAMVLMFQLEVAERIRAELGTRDCGSLSVWIQNRWNVERFLPVPPKAFVPPPEVQSEVIVLTRRETPRISVLGASGANPDLERKWEKLLKASFGHRRKMLRSFFPWRNALELSGVDGTKRAEALQWEEWAKLFQALIESEPTL